ncbi:hypothetical protein NS365_00965 [Aureimonas ureilytica]|uniref:DUF3253 domain-containing protein n=1 Tax=Aureimonas ureilytica TaxID=401562 RepID=A0A147DBJ1_9HYPH|nr:DUF3253 domain-containing protein [Aureimonas ureilytica]KTR08541.1 hypothetical protein NS365_00965 [Aureimonas ureilytica]
MISKEAIQQAIASAVMERGAGKTVCPSEIARSLAGSDEKVWRLMMNPIRAEAVRMAKAGDVRILRKGRPVDPDDFKGIYRLALPDGA